MEHTMAAISKAADIAEARPDTFTALELKKFIDDLAAEERKPFGESVDQAFARVIKTALGQRLFRALRKRQVETGEADHEPNAEQPPCAERPGPPMTTHLQLLHEMAAEHAENDPKLSPLLATKPARAKARALLRVINTPEGAALWRKHMAEINTGAHH